jgi:N-acetylneuraminic acid mutarotase
METQPYKTFKDFLDTIIKMPEDLKNKLAEQFEKKRLEREQGNIEEKQQNVEKEEGIEEKKESTIFESIFGKADADKADADKANADLDKADVDKADANANVNTYMNANPNAEKEKKESTIFDNFFSKEQTNELLNRFSTKSEPKLSMANAPQNRCVIRGW